MILAGITITAVTKNEGIIKRSKRAKTEARIAQIKEKIHSWEQANVISSETEINDFDSTERLLNELKSSKLITKEEYDKAMNELKSGNPHLTINNDKEDVEIPLKPFNNAEKYITVVFSAGTGGEINVNTGDIKYRINKESFEKESEDWRRKFASIKPVSKDSTKEFKGWALEEQPNTVINISEYIKKWELEEIHFVAVFVEKGKVVNVN